MYLVVWLDAGTYDFNLKNAIDQKKLRKRIDYSILDSLVN